MGLLTKASLFASLVACLLTACDRGSLRTGPPNIVIIVADDMGYADLSIHGSTSFSTPRIDSIAHDGVRFSSGYVASPLCSPSRAALLTGRYPQRFGHEFNPPRVIGEGAGLPRTEVTLARILKQHGYRTLAIGKWHLGSARRFHPMRRGFDHFYGFLKGMRGYRPSAGIQPARAITRDGERLPETFEYLTDELGREAAASIERHKDSPFFLYLSFNAVHTPLEARPDVLAEVSNEEPERSRVLIAMTTSLDRAVGSVLDALDEHDLREDTLVVFLNDNGGAGGNESSNAPLRAGKGTPFEGGVRVPFFMRWPGVLPEGQVYPHPVSSLDVVPTALAAAGVSETTPNPLDGVDLIPHVTGARSDVPHPTLHWRVGTTWAVRDPSWKAVSVQGQAPMLFHLENDPAESLDLAESEPERVRALVAKHEAWASSLKPPLWKFQVRTGGPDDSE
jgi:arylsulfatase A-like enzyme